MAETIPLRYAQSLLRLAPVSRQELAEELAALNLPMVLLEDNAVADASIDVEDYGRLFIHLVRRLQPLLSSSDMGDVEDALVFSAYRMMFQAMLHAGTLEQAMRRAAVYFQRLGSPGDAFNLEIDGDKVHCHFEFSARDTPLQSPENFSMEQLNWLPGVTGRILSLAMWHRVCGWFIGSYITLESVQLTQPGGRGKDYARVFDAPVQFDAARDSISFHRRYLAFPIVQSEASLDAMLASYPAELFRIDPAESSVSSKVKHLIGTDFRRALPTLQDVADRLHMTTPTLHRRLQEEGTSFRQLKDHCRKQAAIGHLSNGSHTTQELSELLGFSDSSTFHRAFKKWTGLTPQEYRKQHC